MSHKITLQDIADHCHFSKSMVAQVLRNPNGSKARSATRDLILQTARQLGYYPSLTARSLSTRRTYTIGVIFPNTRSFYDELMMQIDAALKQHQYYGLFVYWDFRGDSERNFREAFERIKCHGVDGIITCQYDEFLTNQGIPVVSYGNERPLIDCVYPDKADYGRRVVRYLYEHGHRNIGCIGFLQDVRYSCIFQEMAALGLSIRSEWMLDSTAFVESGYQNMNRLLNCAKLPTALIVHSDRMVQGILAAAAEHQIRVPEQISIISYDNLFDSPFFVPPLTTFDQCYDRAAELLVDTLLKRIKQPDLPPQKSKFTMPLVERQSVRNLIKLKSERE